jgi:hypothetical protein
MVLILRRSIKIIERNELEAKLKFLRRMKISRKLLLMDD